MPPANHSSMSAAVCMMSAPHLATRRQLQTRLDSPRHQRVACLGAQSRGEFQVDSPLQKHYFRQKGWANWTPFTLMPPWEKGLSEIVECLSKACTMFRSSHTSCMRSCPPFGPLSFESTPDGNGVVRAVLGPLLDAEVLNLNASGLRLSCVLGR